MGLQITFDGYKEEHDEVRYVSKTRGSYSNIVENIKKILSYDNFFVQARINYTDKNICNLTFNKAGSILSGDTTVLAYNSGISAQLNFTSLSASVTPSGSNSLVTIAKNSSTNNLAVGVYNGNILTLTSGTVTKDIILNLEVINELYRTTDYKKTFQNEKLLLFDECGGHYDEVCAGTNILDTNYDVDSIHHILEKNKGKVKVLYDFSSIESTIGEIRYEEGVLSFENKIEFNFDGKEPFL